MPLLIRNCISIYIFALMLVHTFTQGQIKSACDKSCAQDQQRWYGDNIQSIHKCFEFCSCVEDFSTHQNPNNIICQPYREFSYFIEERLRNQIDAEERERNLEMLCVCLGILLFVIVPFLVLFIYSHFKRKAEKIATAQSSVNNQIQGRIQIQDSNPTVPQHFLNQNQFGMLNQQPCIQGIPSQPVINEIQIE